MPPTVDVEPKLVSKTYKILNGGPIPIFYRPRSTDKDAIVEVIERRAYRRARSHFDVELGEHWLDLGANIGAFAFYCRLRRAFADCYEPEPVCFSILEQNAPHFNLTNAAVTALEGEMVQFHKSKNPKNFYRGTILPVDGYIDIPPVKNIPARVLLAQVMREEREYDGIKMDIEGSEFGLLDEWLLPPCQKLVMEYHTSRDASVKNLKRRLATLRKHFRHVKYPGDLDRAIEQKLEMYRPRMDRLIFAWDLR